MNGAVTQFKTDPNPLSAGRARGKWGRNLRAQESRRRISPSATFSYPNFLRLEARLDNNDLRQRAKGKLRKANETLSKDSINPASCHRDVRIEFRIGGKEKERERERERKGKRTQRRGERSVWKENYPFLRLFPPLEEESVNRPLITNEKDSLYLSQTPESGV